MTATVPTIPRPRGEISPERIHSISRAIRRQIEADAAYRSEVVAALVEDEASFRVVSELTGLSTNTLQRGKREATS